MLGSPVVGAFLIMEVAGIGGMTLSLLTLPGLLASGSGRWPSSVWITGPVSAPFACAAGAPEVADVGHPRVGVGLGGGRRSSRVVDPLPCTLAPSDRPPEPSVGYARVRSAHRPYSHGVPADLRTQFHPGAVLWTGRTSRARRVYPDGLVISLAAMTKIIDATDYSLAVMIFLILCKSIVYGLSLSAFRGGPVFRNVHRRSGRYSG